MKQACTWIALAVLSTGSLLGCEHERPKPPPPAPAANPIPQSRQADTTILTDHARKLSDYVAQMPGSSGGEHRRLLVGALTELSWVLRAANGAEVSPEFADLVAVIDSAARTASNPSIPRERMVAVENEALHAAAGGLQEIASRYLFDDDQLKPMIGAVNDQADAADGVMGPMHDLDATECFRGIQAAVQRISDDMVARFGAGETTR